MTRLAHRLVLMMTMAVFLGAPAAWAQNARPLRIALLVDSSDTVASMVNSFRAGLKNFVDTLPPDAEVTFLTSGGQIGIRVPVTTDREKLRTEIDRFTSRGGANALVDTLLEADKRFLKPATDKRPVFVILTTDSGEIVPQNRVDEYNRFMRDFMVRGGVAHVIILKGRSTGPVTDVLINLTTNTGGVYQSIAIANAVPEIMKSIGEKLATSPLAR